jgi:hypothetical protein
MKRVIAVFVLFMAGPAARADEVFLRGGGSVRGDVVQRTADSLVMEVGPGRMTLPMSRVDRIVGATSDLSIYRERAGRLAPGDVAGWLALARWAEGRDLLTQARAAYEHVTSVDPQNAAANAALGRVRLAGQWVSAEESFRARGYVPFEGGWVTPEERSALLVDRAAEARARELTAEAEARAREAEARARTAEADARRAEAEAQGDGNGIPYPFVYGGVGTYGGIYGPGTFRDHSRRGHGSRTRPTVVIQAPPPPPARDEGGSRPRRHGSSPGIGQKD